MWQMFLVNLGISFLKGYINSSDSKQDDKILKIVQDGSRYLCNKGNNDLSSDLADSLLNTFIRD